MLEMERYILSPASFPHGKEWTFVCPECHKKLRLDQPGEPLCTGPSESRDDHPHETMLLLSVRDVDNIERHLPPGAAERRQAGPLYVHQNKEP